MDKAEKITALENLLGFELPTRFEIQVHVRPRGGGSTPAEAATAALISGNKEGDEPISVEQLALSRPSAVGAGVLSAAASTHWRAGSRGRAGDRLPR